jgi:hypothetical protein
MTNTRPYVSLACLCENIIVDATGRRSLINVLDTITITPVPGATGQPVAEFQVVVGVKSGDVVGSSALSVSLRTPSTTVKGGPGPWRVHLMGGVHGAVLNLAIQLQVGEYGLYWFDVFWEGELLTSIPLAIVQGVAQNPPSTNEPTSADG